MWQTEAKHVTTASKESIWKLWSEVSEWNRWDKEVEKSEIFGSFAVGTRGILKPVGGPATKFEITACKPLHSFTDRSFLPLCTIDFTHTMSCPPISGQRNDELSIIFSSPVNQI